MFFAVDKLVVTLRNGGGIHEFGRENKEELLEYDVNEGRLMIYRRVRTPDGRWSMPIGIREFASGVWHDIEPFFVEEVQT